MPILALFVLLLAQTLSAVEVSVQPHLEKHGSATELIVEGRPFLILGAELHNSSSSNLDYMAPIWPKLAAVPLNTVLTPLSWELVEPEEGKFDFGLLDGLLRQAREHNLRIVFLWLAAWKNGMSSYAPLWVKSDTRRFPRVVINGNEVEILSTFSNATLHADSKAFSSVMRHIREIDSSNHTVLMMQVENEVGILGNARDHSGPADRAFESAVPPELTDYLAANRESLYPELRDLWEQNGAKTSGTWEQIFGVSPRTDEIFMAWNYARYVHTVAAAGKAAYNQSWPASKCWMSACQPPTDVFSSCRVTPSRSPIKPSCYINSSSVCLHNLLLALKPNPTSFPEKPSDCSADFLEPFVEKQRLTSRCCSLLRKSG